MNIRSSNTFRKVMYFKFFMVICIWGLVPILIPKDWIPFLGLSLYDWQVIWLRIWGIIVLLDTFVYVYIFKNPNNKLTKYLLVFSILDNAGIGIILIILTFIFKLPWGIWINIPFQLFFGYWFYRFLKAGKFKNDKIVTKKSLKKLALFSVVLILISIFPVLFIKTTISQFDKLSNEISYEEVPKYLVYSTVVSYDKKYFAHDRYGVNPVSMIGKGLYILFHSPNDFGLSYLTANKILDNNNDKSISQVRTLKTVLGAWYLEMKLTREQVLYIFLKESSYAKSIKDIDQAANSYYGKKLTELNLSESILLVSTIDNNKYSDYKYRSQEILEKLKSEHYISVNKQYPNQDQADLEYTLWRFEMEFLNPSTTKPYTSQEMTKAAKLVESLPEVKNYLIQGHAHVSPMCSYESTKGECFGDDDYIVVKLGDDSGPIFATIEWYYVDRKSFAVYKDGPDYNDFVRVK